MIHFLLTNWWGGWIIGSGFGFGIGGCLAKVKRW